MTNLLDLPDEILLEIVTKFLDISECMHFTQTCRAIRKFSDLKIFWVEMARRAQLYRPIPLPDNWRVLQVEEIKAMVVRGMKLGRMLEGARMPEPMKVWALDTTSDTEGAFQPGENQIFPSKEIDPQLWVWLLADGDHVMTMSRKGILRVWGIVDKNVITSFNVMGKPLCWDYTGDATGITIVANVADERDQRDIFRVWRYDWNSSSTREVFSKELPGDIRSNYIEGDLTGCVANMEDGPTYIYVLNWKTLEEISSETPFKLPPYLSAATSPDSLFIYAEDTNYAIYYSYSLEDISTRLSAPHFEVIEPTDVQHCIITSGNLDSAEVWVPSCRKLWDGRTGVFSRGIVNDEFQAGFITLSTINLPIRSPGDGPIHTFTKKLKANGLAMDVTTIERKAVYLIGERGIVAAPQPSEWDLCAMGSFGKTVVWLEYEQESEVTNVVEEVQRVGRENNESVDADSVMVTVSDSSSNGSPENQQDVSQGQEASDDNPSVESGSPSQVSDGDMPDDYIENLALESVPDAFYENSLELLYNQTARAYGHLCELPVSSEWAAEYGGINTVDFDDARGRLAFATGSGKILVWEFV